jgi:hypothetical protein
MLTLPPEFRLVAACAMWPPSDLQTESIRSSAAGPLDWPRFLRVAKRHQVLGLVHDALRRVRPDLPAGLARDIEEQAGVLVRKNLEITRESLRIKRLFEDAGLRVLFVKGAALALLAFGNLGLRASQDIDLLVSYETLPDATALITRAGYRRFDPPPETSEGQLRQLMAIRKDFGFVHQVSGLRIELHWRLFLNQHAIAETPIMAASRVVPVTETEGLRTLGEEDLFAYLCMHGALHWWNRLKWVADISALLAGMPDDRTERLVRAAQARGVGRAAAQALLLCWRLLGTRRQAAIVAMLDNGPTVRWIEMTALRAMTAGHGESDPHDARFGTTRGSLSTFLLSPSWRYQLTELKVQLTNQSDILAVPLPERLHFLYPILRLPLWIWRHVKQRDAS